MNMGELTPFTCPECHGMLVNLVEGNLLRYRCHTGHAYTLSTLLAEVSESIEKILWQAMRGLEEMNMLLSNIGDHFDELKNPEAAAFPYKSRYKRNARPVNARYRLPAGTIQ